MLGLGLGSLVVPQYVGAQHRPKLLQLGLEFSLLGRLHVDALEPAPEVPLPHRVAHGEAAVLQVVLGLNVLPELLDVLLGAALELVALRRGL
eukprot:2327373-Alexandrium_andersonii.AAC.1